ncbi:hypothetical protein L3Y34_011566 [Caenorhabditis briggsae]|uniref:C2H2-type domain-containing protein n=2 Tax=Caenorhabditis briggsae TaxID=6238 RepID=A0AAE9CU34_CAEBR|nr:hypothetical protein L3Y34_011566 [Caenorhabditis briggsae]
MLNSNDSLGNSNLQSNYDPFISGLIYNTSDQESILKDYFDDSFLGTHRIADPEPSEHEKEYGLFSSEDSLFADMGKDCLSGYYPNNSYFDHFNFATTSGIDPIAELEMAADTGHQFPMARQSDINEMLTIAPNNGKMQPQTMVSPSETEVSEPSWGGSEPISDFGMPPEPRYTPKEVQQRFTAFIDELPPPKSVSEMIPEPVQPAQSAPTVVRHVPPVGIARSIAPAVHKVVTQTRPSAVQYITAVPSTCGQPNSGKPVLKRQGLSFDQQRELIRARAAKMGLPLQNDSQTQNSPKRPLVLPVKVKGYGVPDTENHPRYPKKRKAEWFDEKLDLDEGPACGKILMEQQKCLEKKLKYIENERKAMTRDIQSNRVKCKFCETAFANQLTIEFHECERHPELFAYECLLCEDKMYFGTVDIMSKHLVAVHNVDQMPLNMNPVFGAGTGKADDPKNRRMWNRVVSGLIYGFLKDQLKEKGLLPHVLEERNMEIKKLARTIFHPTLSGKKYPMPPDGDTAPVSTNESSHVEIDSTIHDPILKMSLEESDAMFELITKRFIYGTNTKRHYINASLQNKISFALPLEPDMPVLQKYSTSVSQPPAPVPIHQVRSEPHVVHSSVPRFVRVVPKHSSAGGAISSGRHKAPLSFPTMEMSYPVSRTLPEIPKSGPLILEDTYRPEARIHPNGVIPYRPYRPSTIPPSTISTNPMPIRSVRPFPKFVGRPVTNLPFRVVRTGQGHIVTNGPGGKILAARTAALQAFPPIRQLPDGPVNAMSARPVQRRLVRPVEMPPIVYNNTSAHVDHDYSSKNQ